MTQQRNRFRLRLETVCVLTAALTALGAQAAGPEDAHGLWMTADKDAVLEFKPCAAPATSLCGRIVWDKDAGTATDACGTVVAQLDKYDNNAWREGWIHDPRDRKKYKGVIRVKGGDLHMRAFIGTEILGQTEELNRVRALPAAPVCKN